MMQLNLHLKWLYTTTGGKIGFNAILSKKFCLDHIVTYQTLLHPKGLIPPHYYVAVDGTLNKLSHPINFTIIPECLTYKI
jgi:hypothetical protein